MPESEIAELTLQERGILATAASAAYLDHFSKGDRSVISVYQSVAVCRKRKYYSRGQEFLIEWQDYGQPLPAWFDPLVQGFVDLLTLPTNWDSYGGRSVEPNLVQEAMNLMNSHLAPSSPAPHAVPLSSGGLQLEWHRKGIDLEIVFDRGEEPYFYSQNRVSGEEAEQSLTGNDHVLRTLIGQLE
jgi:hypothetical protein